LQIVPYSDEMERALLVGMLTDPSLVPRVTTSLDEEDFFRENHKEIYKAIRSLEIDSIDSLTVQDKLSEGTRPYYIDLVKNSESLIPSLTNIMVYVETIKDKSKLRSGINLGREITALCYDSNAPATETLQKLEDMFAKFLQHRVITEKVQNTKDAFSEFVENLRYNIEEIGIRTGFTGIDMLLHSLEGMIILAGRPSTGKTALAINIIRNVAETNHVAFFSLEQSRDQIFQRMLASEAQVNSEEIGTGAYLADDDAVEKIKVASKKLEPLLERIHIDDKASVNTSYITSVARQKAFEWGAVGLIVVDYLHIMELNDKASKVDALGDAVKELRALGKELNAPVLLLSQLSRQSDNFMDDNKNKKHRRPELTDLRSSGEIEQSADIVMFLYRESYYDAYSPPPEDIIEVIVRKNRNGRIGIGTLAWIPRYLKFRDI
jgi:replicative DNA helicase